MTNSIYDKEDYYKQYYYHSDHLGSASLISDNNGDEYQRIEYTPYGETWVEKTSNTGLEYLPYKFTAKEQDEETGLYYYGARYLDSRYSRWISTDPALGDYVPQAPISDEAKKHNQNLPGMGGVFNHINGNLYHYAGNNPVRYIDPDGNAISGTRWLSRNWDNLLSIGINVSEVISGVGIATATGVTGAGAFMGSLMMAHGSINTIAGIGKIVTTTIAADLYGENYADKLDEAMPDTAIGFVGYGLGFLAETLAGGNIDGTFAEKIGAFGDLLDTVCGIAISANAEKVLTQNINEFIKSSSSNISKGDLLKLQKYLSDTKRVTASKVLEGVIEKYDTVTGLDSNLKQISE